MRQLSAREFGSKRDGDRLITDDDLFRSANSEVPSLGQCIWRRFSGLSSLFLMGGLWLQLFFVNGLQAETWHVPGAVYRFKIDLTKGSSWPTSTGYAGLWSNGLNLDKLQIRVHTAAGLAVGQQLLWKSEGAPLKLLFDTSSRQTSYYVYLGESRMAEAPSWQPQAGLILETRKRPDGPVDSWPQVKQLWNRASPILGRSLVSKIYTGIHPHGPTRDFLSYFHGAFRAREEGDYEFSTASDDASFLFIDGKLVAQWPGWHGVHRGRRGRYSGRIRLTKGTHRIEYYNVQNESGFQVVAGWQPPGSKYSKVIPSGAFYPVAHFGVTGVEAKNRRNAAACFGWNIEGHTEAGGRTLVSVRFLAFGNGRGKNCRWLLDDGSAAYGREVHHVFARPGMRNVRLEVQGTSLTQKVDVHPLWQQREAWPKHVAKRQARLISSKTFSTAPVEDILYLRRFAEEIKERNWLVKLGRVCLARKGEFGAEHAGMFLQTAFYFQHPDFRDYRSAEACFRTALAMVSDDPALKEKIKLHLSGFLIHCHRRADSGLALLKNIDEQKLSGTERRLKQIFEADAYLTRGEVNVSRRLYIRIGNVVERSDIHYAARRRARLESAKDFLLRKEFKEAERIVREIEWETPLERLNTETGIIMVGIQFGRKEYPFALATALRLLAAAPMDRHRAKILLKLIDIYLVIDEPQPAAEMFRKLQKEHPYSEAAAIAKDHPDLQRLKAHNQ